jgi:hypothetical protein
MTLPILRVRPARGITWAGSLLVLLCALAIGSPSAVQAASRRDEPAPPSPTESPVPSASPEETLFPTPSSTNTIGPAPSFTPSSSATLLASMTPTTTPDASPHGEHNPNEFTHAFA